MWEVAGALVPVVGAATWYFGVTALLVIFACASGAVVTEWSFSADRRRLGSLLDGSALLTGVLLALTLPPSIPLWMAFIGGVAAIALGKSIWGGLGQNLFNPALVGRAFLQAAFPVTMTTWSTPREGLLHLDSSTLAAPLMHVADATTTATPLGMAKFEGTLTDVSPLLFGNTAGSLGETAALVLIVCGLYLGFRQALHWIRPEAYPGAPFMLMSGGLLFGAVFMVTDPVTTPITKRGAWIFGLGVGLLVVLIRLFGGLPEGVMYSILLMNSVTPLINRYTQPRRFGG
jgi:electron transport complex protein RnfD